MVVGSDGVPTTLYIAGPMSGYPGYNYQAFEDARVKLETAGYSTLCPTDSEKMNETGEYKPWDWYMRHALRMVLTSHGVAVLPEWALSRGARLEIEVATALQLPILPIDVWLAKVVAEHSTVDSTAGV